MHARLKRRRQGGLELGEIVVGKLAQFNEKHASGVAVRRMRAAGGVAHVTARRIIAVFITEHAIQHEELFAQRMAVRVEARTGCVAHNAGRHRHFVAHPVQHHPLYSG